MAIDHRAHQGPSESPAAQVRSISARCAPSPLAAERPVSPDWAHNLSARNGSERGQRGGVPLSAGRHPKLTMILE